MFEKVLRLKLRFDTPRGQLTAEDLWDLPLTGHAGRANLDDIARGLHRQLRSGDDVSFVVPDKKSDETVQLKFDVVKHVIDVRLVEANLAAEAQERAAKKQRVMAKIAEKDDEALHAMSKDELQKILAEL
jgi:hypothetical protein